MSSAHVVVPQKIAMLRNATFAQLWLITSAEGDCVFGSVCLSVRRITEKNCERILTKFIRVVRHGPGTSEFNFGDDPDQRPDPGVRSPKWHSLDYRKSYQRILMKFYGELGCGLETNWLHFGDDPRHYLDPGVRYGSRSRPGKKCHVVNTKNRCPAKIIQQLCWRSAEVCALWVLLVLGCFSAENLPFLGKFWGKIKTFKHHNLSFRKFVAVCPKIELLASRLFSLSTPCLVAID